MILKLLCSFSIFYHVSYESDEKYAPSANINKNGIVSLSVLNKDGRGIIWDGNPRFFYCNIFKRRGIPFWNRDGIITCFCRTSFPWSKPILHFIPHIEMLWKKVASFKRKEIPTTFTLSRDDIDLMLREYSGFFTETTINGEKVFFFRIRKITMTWWISLSNSVNICTNLFLTAFSDKQAVESVILSNE